jgi:hypothetical protein
MLIRFLPLACVLLALSAAAAPVEPIATDRPDFVDSSTVVGTGVFQIEAGFATERNRDAGLRERSNSTPLLLRLGVSDNLELRLETDGRLHYRSDGVASVRQQGWGDAGLSVKWHALDAKDGGPSIGFIAQADVDSGSAAFRGSGVRPSLRMAAEWDLPNDWSVGLMPGLTRDRNDVGAHMMTGMFGVTVGKEWTERMHTFVEVAAPRIARARDGGTQATFDVGAGYLLTPNWAADFGLSFGLNHRTADRAFTFGLSTRL